MQESDKGRGYDFRHGERPSDHTWRWHANDVGGQRVALGVAGIDHHIGDVTKFVSAAFSAEESEGRYGILLERDPDNQYDRHAIRVLGWTGDPSSAVLLGYLHREDAASIAKEFPADMPIAAALWRVYFTKATSKGWVGIRLLVPAQRDPWRREHQAEV
jgi:hypothetical protein